MDTALLISILAIVVLLILSAFFSGSETALTAASRARLHHLERKGSRRAGLVNRLIESRERMIGAILLGNNLVNILATALAASVFISVFGDAGVIYATIVMTLVVVVFAEVLPKTYAIRHADRMALAVAPVMRFVVGLFSPITRSIQAAVGILMRVFGAERSVRARLVTPAEELRGAIDLHTDEGGILKHEGDMLGSILDLSDVRISEIMVHRKQMYVIDAGLPPAQAMEAVLASPYTRIPIWRDQPENIRGVLHSKNVLRALSECGGDLGGVDVGAIAAEPWFVPETTTLHEQLGAFRRRHAHFALVVDEYGALQGLVTLEDILEEIVGDIADEHDVAATGIRTERDGSIVVDGTVTIRDLNRQFDWDLPDEEAATVAGLVIHEARLIPKAGQAFDFHGFTFEVLRRRRNQITALRVRPPPPGATTVAS